MRADRGNVRHGLAVKSQWSTPHSLTLLHDTQESHKCSHSTARDCHGRGLALVRVRRGWPGRRLAHALEPVRGSHRAIHSVSFLSPAHGTTDVTSSDISTYNTFVNNPAEGPPSTARRSRGRRSSRRRQPTRSPTSVKTTCRCTWRPERSCSTPTTRAVTDYGARRFVAAVDQDLTGATIGVLLSGREPEPMVPPSNPWAGTEIGTLGSSSAFNLMWWTPPPHRMITTAYFMCMGYRNCSPLHHPSPSRHPS